MNKHMIIKCKMCGGDVVAKEGQPYGECDACGSAMTLPSAVDERVANLFNRANHFRRLNEFDKALSTYEGILNEDPGNAEAHWGALLCRYGIEYVEDPHTHEMVPTCHRAQYESVMTDADYLAALENAPDSYAREIYEKEAAAISEVQKGILAISRSEQPYDVFICYKEATDGGSRTKDSSLAQDIYYQLDKAGYRTFFSRISLEDKIGHEYEPYIFSALNSARVMLVIGTKAEYFNAVWVKNEWSRYLKLLKKDRSRLLIPCYQEMDAYDLPEELSMLQSQDMGKIGFVQDLLHGVEKVLGARKAAASAVSGLAGSAAAPGVESLIKRAWLFLEDADWKQAGEYFNRVLDIDPEFAPAYVGKLCALLNVKNEAALAGKPKPLIDIPDYQKALRFGDSQLRSRLEGYNNEIVERIRKKEELIAEEKRRELERLAEEKRLEEERKRADAERRAEEERQEQERQQQERERQAQEQERIRIEQEAEAARYAEERRRSDYEEALRKGQAAKTRSEFTGVVAAFKRLGYYQDSPAQADKYDKLAKAAQKKRNILIASAIAAVVIVIAVLLVITQYVIPNGKYKDAQAKYDSGDYERASDIFKSLGDFKDSKDYLYGTLYYKAVALVESGDNYGALAIFEELDNYNDSAEYMYYIANAFHEAGSYDDALDVFGKLGDYKDSKSRIIEMGIAKMEGRIWLAAGNKHTVGLNSDGTVMAVGSNNGLLESDRTGQCHVTSWKNIVSVYTGNYHTIGIRADGTARAVGSNDDGQCDVSKWHDIVSAAAGFSHTVGLMEDGTVVAVGSNYHGQCDVSQWHDIVAIAACWRHTVGLKSDGTLITAGSNEDGQCDVSGWSDIVAISAGNYHTVGLKSDGTVVAVGSNEYNQCDVSNWSDIIAITAGNIHTVGLKADGTVVTTGIDSGISEWRDIIAIAAGSSFTVGLMPDGTLVAKGYNSDGQCDISDWKFW